MNTFLDIDNFIEKKGEVAGEECTLICPEISAKWTKDNLIYRASIWNGAGQLVSASFPKFFNLNEKPDLTPPLEPPFKVIQKVDGSTLIVSKYKGEYIFRTRETFNAKKHKNGHELNDLIEKYKLKELDPEPEKETWDRSYLFEWVSPANQIVIHYSEPDLFLIGIIDHRGYRLWQQSSLDAFAFLKGLKRPKIYRFSSLKEIVEEVNLWKGEEGVCVYFNNEQDIRKIKGEWYLSLHRLKSELSSFDKLLNFYIAAECPAFEIVYQQIVDLFDFELAEMVRPNLQKIVEGNKKAETFLKNAKEFINELREFTRKEKAQIILERSKKFSKIYFNILDSREPDKKTLILLCLED